MSTTDPLFETWNDGRSDLRVRLSETTGVELGAKSHTPEPLVREIAKRLEISPTGSRYTQIQRIREEHPELDSGKNSRDFSVAEFRELYASLERGEVIGDE